MVWRIFHATIIRSPEQRAIFHYITQTLFRVPRYRIYLVLYGGVGLSIVIASVLRFSTLNDQIQVIVSTDGLRASAGMVAFWAIAGFVSLSCRQETSRDPGFSILHTADLEKWTLHSSN